MHLTGEQIQKLYPDIPYPSSVISTNWYFLSDHIEKPHPSINVSSMAQNRELMRRGVISYRIRSVSSAGKGGGFPGKLPHRAHRHHNCRINKDAVVVVSNVRNRPFSYGTSGVSFMCEETDQEWLRQLDFALRVIQHRRSEQVQRDLRK